MISIKRDQQFVHWVKRVPSSVKSGRCLPQLCKCMERVSTVDRNFPFLLKSTAHMADPKMAKSDGILVVVMPFQANGKNCQTGIRSRRGHA